MQTDSLFLYPCPCLRKRLSTAATSARRTRRLARMCDCVGRTLLLILMLVGCFTIVLLSPTDSTARPLVLRTKSLHNQVQHASTAVSGSPPLAKKATALRPGPAGDAVGRSPAPARKPAQLAAFVPWDGHRGLERWRSAGLMHGTPRSVLAWKRSARPAAPSGDECLGHGVYNPRLEECRCTAGWAGLLCHERRLRPCNSHKDVRAKLGTDALCAGNCDDERGLCYCAGHKTPFQRPLPHVCAPAATPDAKLPDGRPLYPRRAPDGSWEMAPLIWERSKGEGPKWARPWAKPIELVYGQAHAPHAPHAPHARQH